METVNHSPEYLAAWKRLGAAGWNVNQLPADDRRALEEDPHTKEWMKELRTAAPEAAAPEKKTFTGRAIDAFFKAFTQDDKADWDAIIDECPKQPINFRLLNCFVITPMLAMNKKNRERNDKIAALEARVTSLEEAPKYTDKGIWNGLEPYKPGDHVTVESSLWACLHANVSQKPGSQSTAKYWRLASKGGLGREPR